MKIIFITSNKGKVIETQKKLSEFNIQVIQKNFGYPEIQASTLEEVADFGVKYLKKKIKKPFILEDAGLFIKSLKGFPGVFSSYVYHTIGCEGIIRLMSQINDNKRNAIFKSVFAYSEPGSKPIFFIGECKGKITHSLRGMYGFGYDPIFTPEGHDKTFAEIDVEQKNKFSHRSKALEKLANFFKNK